MFQSLSGFLMRCDCRRRSRARPGAEFQSLSGFLMRCDLGIAAAGVLFFVFQSLSGFLMRCDTDVTRHTIRNYQVSIPIGFSDAL